MHKLQFMPPHKGKEIRNKHIIKLTAKIKKNNNHAHVMKPPQKPRNN